MPSALTFVAYRERSPAVLLGVEEQYGSPWDGRTGDESRRDQHNAAHVDAAEAVFADVTRKFRA